MIPGSYLWALPGIPTKAIYFVCHWEPGSRCCLHLGTSDSYKLSNDAFMTIRCQWTHTSLAFWLQLKHNPPRVSLWSVTTLVMHYSWLQHSRDTINDVSVYIRSVPAAKPHTGKDVTSSRRGRISKMVGETH